MDDLDSGIKARDDGASTKRRLKQRPTLGLLIVCGLIAVAYLWLVGKYCAPYADGSDSSGYLNIARLLSRGEAVVKVPRIEGLTPPAWDYYYQQPLGFDVNRRQGTMVPTYPAGFPLHLLLATLFVGLSQATVLVNILLAAAAAGLMIALGRRFGLPWSWSLAAAALLWACPLFIFLAVQPMSDLPAMVWSMAAIWFALRARESWRWGLAAGFAVGVAVLIRPSDVLLLLPVAVAIGLRWRAWIAIVAGGLPGAAFLAWYNLRLYGALLISSYGETRSLFSLVFLPHNLAHFALWIPLLICPVVAFAALGIFRLRRVEPLLTALLTVWIGSFIGFYAFYFHSGEEWSYMRFLLPAFPAVILAGLLAVRRGRWPSEGWRRWLLPVFLGIVLLWDVAVGRWQHVGTYQRGAAVYKQAAEWMRAHAPANAIVLQMQLSGCFAYDTDFTIVRWDFIGPAEARQLYAAARAAHRPVYATLFDFERESAFLEHLPGNWRQLTRIRQISVWELDEPALQP